MILLDKRQNQPINLKISSIYPHIATTKRGVGAVTTYNDLVKTLSEEFYVWDVPNHWWRVIEGPGPLSIHEGGEL